MVAAERLDDVRGRVAGVLASGELPGPTAEHLADETGFAWPAELPQARSVVVGATPRPLTRATLTLHGEPHEVVVPPHYAGYHTVPDGLAAAVGAALAPAGHRAARFEPPLKTLAAAAGLARYGRNNIVYVPGLGSYLMLAACATDAPPPDGRPLGRAAAAGALRALQRLPPRLPRRRHPRGPVPPADGPLPHRGQRVRGAVPGLGRPGLAPRRGGLPALPAVLPGERRRRAPGRRR